MTDDSLQNALVGKSALQEFGGRWQFGDIFGVTQTVSDHARGHDDGAEAAQLLIAHFLKAFLTPQRRLIFMTEKGQKRLAPQPAQKVEISTFLGKTVLIICDLRLVVVTFDENRDFFTS